MHLALQLQRLGFDDVEASLVFIARSPGTVLKNSKIYEGGQGIVIAFSRDCVIDNNSLPESLEGIVAASSI